MITDNKKRILQFIAKSPGIKSIDIKVGLGRASIGALTRALMDVGMLVKDQSNGWHIAHDFVVEMEPAAVTPMDVLEKIMDKMIRSHV